MIVQLKKLVPMEMLINQQAIMRKEILLKWENREIGNEECGRQMRKALEMTLPYEAFLKEGKKYLTYEEQSCVQNMMLGMKKNDVELLTCMQRFEEIYQPYIDNGLHETISGMYELIMGHVGSMWGNMGEYDKADKHSSIIIQGCLRFRRLMVLHDGLYDQWWNYSERKRKDIPTDKVLNDVQEITNCLLLSKLSKRKARECFYQKKLASVYEGITVKVDCQL